MDLDQLAAHSPNLMLAQEAYGLLNAPTAIWFGTLPDDTGLNSILRRTRLGNTPKKWFVPITGQEARPSLKNRLATHTIMTLSRMFGTDVPQPEPLSLDQAIVLSRWAAETMKEQGACLVLASVSMLFRVCMTAREHGLDISGVTFWGGSEPPTPANKVLDGQIK